MALDASNCPNELAIRHDQSNADVRCAEGCDLNGDPAIAIWYNGGMTLTAEEIFAKEAETHAAYVHFASSHLPGELTDEYMAKVRRHLEVAKSWKAVADDVRAGADPAVPC